MRFQFLTWIVTGDQPRPVPIQMKWFGRFLPIQLSTLPREALSQSTEKLLDISLIESQMSVSNNQNLNNDID